MMTQSVLTRCIQFLRTGLKRSHPAALDKFGVRNMSHIIIRLALAIALTSVASGSARADILAGHFGTGGVAPNDVVAIFGDAMNGNVAPMSVLGGANTTINSVSTMTYDPAERTLLLADFIGQQILVFDAAARLDATPLRRFTSPFMGQPREVVPIPQHDEYVVLNASFILYFARSANGTATILRRSDFQPALIDNLDGLEYLPATDEVAVGDYQGENGVFHGEVLFFARTASGMLTPTRRLAGPATMLGQYVAGIATDPVSGELHVLSGDGSTTPATARINTYAANADGNAAPLRSIAGPATLLTSASALSLYPFRDELLVTVGHISNETPHILGFPRTASGNVAPTRNISGANTGGVSNDGWYGVVGVPLELVFSSGFE